MRNQSGRPIALFLAISAAAVIMQFQTASASAATAIVIPVTVTNKAGAPVTGLTEAAFSVQEGNRSLTVESVAEIAPLTAGKNRFKVAFVVMDAIATPMTVQPQIRKECLQFLATSVANGVPVSLSEIGRGGLRVVHEVTTPNSVLSAALLAIDSEKPFLTNADQLRALAAPQDKSLLLSETDRLRQFRQGAVELANMIGRFTYQLQAFQQIATALEHVQGRKTIVWLTGYFPVDIAQGQDSITLNSRPIKSATIDYQRTINMLNTAQISVFPVQLSDNTSDPKQQMMVYGQSNLDRNTTNGLRQFARGTGGEAMNGSSVIEELVKRAQDGTTSYYLVKFTPEKVKSDTKWRPLKVQVSVEAGLVNAPNGYFVSANSP
jgi:VWFA-related protein